MDRGWIAPAPLQMLAEAVYAFAASHRMPFTDTERLMARVKDMLDARAAAAASTGHQQVSSDAAGALGWV